MLMLHIFHHFGEWQEVGHGMIVRARRDVIKGQLLSSADVGKIVIGKFIKRQRKCKSCPKVKTKFEDVIYG